MWLPLWFLWMYGGVYYVVRAADVSPVVETDSRMMLQGFPGRCRREPPGVNFPKSPGDNGFYIMISGKPNKYVSGELYTVTLQGESSELSAKKFIGFMLIAEPKDNQNDMARLDVGSFVLSGNAMTKYSEECPNALMHASLIPKLDIKVKWKAPPAGTGCVVFKATVQENKELWYMDEGGLTRELCEEEEENWDKQPEIIERCCACDEAKYELTFEGLWSRQTHPRFFPTNEWLTHFSDIIGASHTNDFRMWEYKGIASEGVKEVAETGFTKTLESELKTESDKIRTVIKARGLWYPNVQSRTFAVFRVDKQSHLVSFLTMLSPSPDWIVGVSALELCLPNCSWAAERVMNLYPWDAGTDNGLTYIGAKMTTFPREKIRRITSSSPNNPQSPFYDASGAPMKPIARLTVTRQRVYEKQCDERETMASPTILYPLIGEVACQVTDWTEWTQCSVSCGEGQRMRTRHYLNKVKAEKAGCALLVIDKRICSETCIEDISCITTDWSEWSECSVACGKGLRKRSRQYLDIRARKTCALELTEEETCTGMMHTCQEDPMPDRECAVTHWSEWSPCMVTCGKGMKLRTRLYLSPGGFSVCNVLLKQEAPCNADNPECTVSLTEAKKNCMQPQEVGPCRGYYPRWYYDVDRSMCQQFIYSGCRGNRNNFQRYIDCNKMCEAVLKDQLIDLSPSSTYPSFPTDQPPAIDCVVTSWSEWTPCTTTCGNGRRERRRIIKMNPQNGGTPCPKLVQRRKCRDNPSCRKK